MSTPLAKVDVGEKGSTGVHGKTKQDIYKLIRDENIELVDAVFTDPVGLWQHCTFTANQLDDEAFDVGLPFDGSSIKLFKVINESDMLMKPDPNTAFIDPFAERKTLHIACNIHEPENPTGEGYGRCPRSIAMRAEKYLKTTGIADTAFFGPEAEFFMFDNVYFSFEGHKAMFELDVEEGFWNGAKPGPNKGHRAEAKGWYFPVAPIDRSSDIRGEMLLTMAKLGVPVEKHHHEVAVGQSELGFRALSMTSAADNLQIYKYVIKNVALKHGKTVTFMPKPVYGDNGTGMHVHQSLWKDGKPLFWDSNGKYVNFSDMGLNYIGGVLHHAPALCAFTNSTTNSYKRLVPGFEAPVNLAYSKGNRSAAIRIPMYHPTVPKYKRMEFRCPDALSNPYLAFAACLMAGLDGIKNKIHPGEPIDVDIYELSDEERVKIRKTPPNLSAALDALEKDHDFLLQGGVFTKDYIEAYIKSKRAEVTRVDSAPHPLEFILYYHL